MKKNKYFKPVACLVLGVTMLSVAVFANYDNANGYTAYKNALKQIPFEENFTGKINVKMAVDNQEIVNVGSTMKFDKNGEIKSSTEDQQKALGESGYSSRSYLGNGVSVSESTYEGRESATEKRISVSKSSATGLFFEGDLDVISKGINFAEIIADGFVGDLKNNFVMTKDENGNKTYNVTLTEAQVPEIVNSGLALASSAMKSVFDKSELSSKAEGGADELSANAEGGANELLNSIIAGGNVPKVTYARCDLTVNEYGKLTKNTMEGTLMAKDVNGVEHNLTMTVDADLADYGTTKADSFDIAENVNITLKDGTVLNSVSEMMKFGKSIHGTLADGTNFNLNPIDYTTDEYRGEESMYIEKGVEISADEYQVLQQALNEKVEAKYKDNVKGIEATKENVTVTE
ncbi:MAG: hypothetical protein RSA27_00790 [Oscillospiraceae bacterium]